MMFNETAFISFLSRFSYSFANGMTLQLVAVILEFSALSE